MIIARLRLRLASAGRELLNDTLVQLLEFCGTFTGQQPERRVAAMLERAVVLLVSNLRRHFINPCLRFAKQIMLRSTKRCHATNGSVKVVNSALRILALFFSEMEMNLCRKIKSFSVVSFPIAEAEAQGRRSRLWNTPCL
jgi:hypothetical protein